MKKILEQWTGQYIINGKVVDNLKDWKPKNGEQIKIRLLARRNK